FGLKIRTSWPPTLSIANDCAAVPLHAQIWMFVPSAMPAPLTSRQLPEFGLTILDIPPPRSSTRHAWAAVPLQAHSCTLVPSAVPAPLTSRHFPEVARVPKLYVPATRFAVNPSTSSRTPPAPQADAPATDNEAITSARMH